MLLKIGKTTPRCPKLLPGDEYTDESWLPGGNIPGSLGSQVMNTPWSFDSPVMNRGVDFLVHFEQASEQLYKKNFVVNNTLGSQDSPVY